MKFSTHISNNNQIEEDDNFNFKEVILNYLRYWRFFVISISIALIAAFLTNKFTPPVYKIESKFLIREEANAMNLIDFGTTGEGEVLPKGQKLANETVIFKSRRVAGDVIDQLHFDVEYYKERNFQEGRFVNSEMYSNTPIIAEIDWSHSQLSDGQIRVTWQNRESYQLEFLDEEYQLVTPGEDRNLIIERPVLEINNFAFDQFVELPFARFQLMVIGSDDSGSLIIKFRDRKSLISQYTGDNLKISPTSRISSILLFSLETEQPMKGRDYLDMLMQVFLDTELKNKNALDVNTINFIDGQISGISDTLSYTENKLERFRSRSRTNDINNESNTIYEKLSDLENSLSEEKYKREYYLHLQNYLVREDYAGLVVPSGLGIDDPVLNRLIGDLMILQSEKSRFLATQTENSPTVLEVNRKIHDLNESIKEVLANVALNTNRLIADLEKRKSRIEYQFGSLPQKEQDMANIQRSYTLNENLYTFLLQRRAESAISLASNTPSNKIIEDAVLNLIPMQIKPLLNYFLAILLGLTVPLAFVFSMDFFAVKIKEIKEIEQKLRVPVLGYIGRNKEKSQLVVLNQPRIGIAESFRSLRTNINFIYTKEKQITIMITSNIAGEGKTFCAMNLASIYSMSGKKTILVGCDLHKSFKFEDFKVKNISGLSTYLSGQESDLQSVIQKTDYGNLDILVPGPIPPNPAELIISDHFDEMMKELKRKYDVIIMDSSPLGLTNETLYLTRMADFSLFILRQNYSKKAFAEDINSLKEKKGVENLYVVLNDIPRKYLSHGGYGYGYYQEDRRQQPVLQRIFGGARKQA